MKSRTHGAIRPSPRATSTVDRRTFLAAAAAGAAAATVGGTLGARAAQAAPAAAGPVTITYWHFYKTGPLATSLKQILAAFEQQYPAIKVNSVAVPFPSFDAYNQKLFLAVTGGNPPDVWSDTDSAEFGVRGFLTPLNDYFKASNMSFNPADWGGDAVAFATLGKTIYGMLHETDTRALWWDKAAFSAAGLDPETPPKTWSQWLDYAKRLTTRDSSGRITRAGFAATTGEAIHPYIYMGLAGGAPNRQWFTYKGPVPVANFSSPACVKGMEFYRTLVDAVGGVQQLSAFTKGFSSTLVNPLFSGQAAMVITGDWTISDAKEYAPKLNYGVAPFPRPDDGGVHYNISGGWQLAIPKGAAHPMEAWTLIKFMESAKWMRKWCLDGSYIIPERHAAANVPLYAKWPYSVFQAEAPYASGWPQDYFGYPEYDTYAATQDIIYHRMSAKDALAKVDKEYATVISRYFGV